MGFIDRFRRKKQSKDASAYRAEREGYSPLVNGLDPASTALLYTTVASSDTSDDRDEDVSDNADDTGYTESYVDDPKTDATYHDTSYTSDSYSSGGSDSSYSDSGSSYSDSGSSDSGSFSSSD